MLLDPGLSLTLRPMRYPSFFERYKNGVKNNWTVDEVDFSSDVQDLRSKMSPAEQHLIHRLVAFFATGDSIVSNNLALNLYKHINAPEARMYLSRQIFEEALHVQFYLLLLDTYITDQDQRADAFRAVESIPSIKKKADFCLKYTDRMTKLEELKTKQDRREFLLNLYAYAGAVEGLFFFGAFAYVFFLRSRGLLNGLATGTNWVFKDESCHMEFAFECAGIIRQDEPDLFDASLERDVRQMMREALACEEQFAEDVLSQGIIGMSIPDMKQYLRFIANQRLAQMGYAPEYNAKNPFGFMDLQDVQEHANFFERKVSAYQATTEGKVEFGMDF